MYLLMPEARKLQNRYRQRMNERVTAMYKYLLFDLDGTLTDPKEGITKSVRYALEKEGYGRPPLEDLMSFIGPPLHMEFCRYCQVDEAEGKRLVSVYRERFAEIGLFENKVFDGIADMLAALKKAGKKLAVATSKPTVYSVRILEKFELAQYFDVVVGSNLDGSRTVKCEVIEEVLGRFGVSDEERDQCLMVGDREHDIIGARSCGISSAGVLFGYSKGSELADAGADHLLGTVEELTAFLLSH